MKNLFPIIIIILFFLAGIVAFQQKNVKSGLIYILSALLNIVFLMKG